VVTDGGFVEALWHRTNSRWYAIALYNRVRANRPLLDVRLGGAANVARYEALTAGAGYLLERNLRLHGEATHDRVTGTMHWAVGLTTAF
jgi:hypothetical protein